MPPTMIREAQASDIPELAEAMVRVQDAHVAAFPTIYRPFHESEAAKHLGGLLSETDAKVRVMAIGESIVGHAVFRIESRSQNMFVHAQRFGHITQIEVHPQFRKQGYGQLLLDDAVTIAHSERLERIVLDVWAFNEGARRFFLSNGFEPFGAKLAQDLSGSSGSINPCVNSQSSSDV